MGMPVRRFIAANNANDIVYKYLQTGKYEPKPSIQTLANAMDVGDPSNFARILDLFQNDYSAISGHISGATYSDEQIRNIMRECYKASLSEDGSRPLQGRQLSCVVSWLRVGRMARSH